MRRRRADQPNPKRAAALDTLKKQCEMLATLGLTRTYSTTATTGKPAADDYKAAADYLREVGEIGKQFQLTVLFEFVRQSSVGLDVDDAGRRLCVDLLAYPKTPACCSTAITSVDGGARRRPPAPARRGEARALPGRARHAARAARPDHAGHARRRRDAAGRHPAEARWTRRATPARCRSSCSRRGSRSAIPTRSPARSSPRPRR